MRLVINNNEIYYVHAIPWSEFVFSILSYLFFSAPTYLKGKELFHFWTGYVSFFSLLFSKITSTVQTGCYHFLVLFPSFCFFVICHYVVQNSLGKVSLFEENCYHSDWQKDEDSRWLVNCALTYCLPFSANSLQLWPPIILIWINTFSHTSMLLLPGLKAGP